MKRFNWRDLAERGEAIIADVRSGKASPALRNYIKDRSPESIGMWFYENRVFFVMLDNFQFQYSKGFMAEESWDAFRRQLRDELSKESTVAYYHDYRFSLRASFEELCDELLEDTKAGR